MRVPYDRAASAARASPVRLGSGIAPPKHRHFTRKKTKHSRRPKRLPRPERPGGTGRARDPQIMLAGLLVLGGCTFAFRAALREALSQNATGGAGRGLPSSRVPAR
jgi:hypothetical protein